MKKTVSQIISHRDRPIPVLSFPSVSLLGITVSELISSPQRQFDGMAAIADRCHPGASLNMMDLSVEAEAFGAEVVASGNDIPTVTKGIIGDISEASSVKIPAVGTGRTGIYVEGVKRAAEHIDLPVFCGVIGPYSLAGRLFDMTELMYACYDSPEDVKILLDKCATFITGYIKAFRAVGAKGVIMAEPAAGLLSPELCAEFSDPWCKNIIRDTETEDFVFVYHNCGNTLPLAKGLSELGADMYHFGNAVDPAAMLPYFSSDTVIMGNINPLLLRDGTPSAVRAEVKKLSERCGKYLNFLLSTGCDIPASAKWENIDAFFAAGAEFFK